MMMKAPSNQPGQNGMVSGAPTDENLVMAFDKGRVEFLRYLESRLRDRDEAEEVLHTFFLKVIEKKEKVRQVRDLRPWLRKVLTNVLMDHFRQKTREKKGLDAFSNDPAIAGFDKDEIDEIACACMHSLLPALNSAYADIIRDDLKGLRPSDLAARYGISEGNARVRLHRARQALKDALLMSCHSCPKHGFFDCTCPPLSSEPK